MRPTAKVTAWLLVIVFDIFHCPADNCVAYIY